MRKLGGKNEKIMMPLGVTLTPCQFFMVFLVELLMV